MSETLVEPSAPAHHAVPAGLGGEDFGAERFTSGSVAAVTLRPDGVRRGGTTDMQVGPDGVAMGVSVASGALDGGTWDKGILAGGAVDNGTSRAVARGSAAMGSACSAASSGGAADRGAFAGTSASSGSAVGGPTAGGLDAGGSALSAVAIPVQGIGLGLAGASALPGLQPGSQGLRVSAELTLTDSALLPGQRLARGVARALRSLDFVSVEEMIPAAGLRVDLMALGPKGELWVIECKSGRADYASDRKWQGYLEFCDRFFWAVDGDFPTDLLPQGTGLILADAYDAEIIRMAPETPLAGARRKALTQKFARQAAGRLHALRDPRV